MNSALAAYTEGDDNKTGVNDGVAALFFGGRGKLLLAVEFFDLLLEVGEDVVALGGFAGVIDDELVGKAISNSMGP